MDYAMKVYPMHLENGKTEWCVEYPDLKGCVGGGDTIEEAIADAQATKSVYLSYLKDEGIELPVPKDEGSLPSGKIALRVPKTTHKQLLENAQMDGVSLNTYINTAISEKIGRASFSNQRILELEQELAYYKFKDKNLVDKQNRGHESKKFSVGNFVLRSLKDFNVQGECMLQITGMNMYLESIRYSVEQVSKENENVQVSRLLEIVDCTKTKISVRLRKELKSENLNAPFLDISSIGEFYLSDKAMQNFDSIRDMEDYVEKRLDFLVDKVQMDAYLSQLIANVTGSFGNAPVVILSE